MPTRRLPADLAIPLAYAAFSALWILLSDRVAEALAPDAASLTALQTYKGWVFVALSALLVHRLVRAGVVASARVEHELRRTNRALNLLSASNRALVHARSERELLDTVCRGCVEVGGYRLAWIGYRVEDERRSVQPVAQTGFDDGYLDSLAVTWADDERGRGPTGEAIRSGQPFVMRDIQRDPRYGPWREAAVRRGYASSIGLPLIVDGATLGVINLYSPDVDAFDATEVALLDQLARDLGFGIAALRVRAEREQLAADLAAERNLLARRVEERTADLIQSNAALGQALRAKDEFLANMSHELRTPLNAVLGLSESLREQFRGPLNDRQLEMVGHIEASGRHLLTLINDILDLSKIEAGRMDLRRERVGVAEVCEASLLFVREEALKKRLALGLHLSDQLATVEADPKRLKQILVNLLSNAVKFTPEGGRVRLEVELDEAAGVARFAVEDTGIGIAAEELPRLFKPFVQLDSGLSRLHTGTGLGLALVHRLAELHGGSVTVRSEPGAGSRFTVALPYAPAPRAAAPSGPAPHAARPRTALVVEDSAFAREQLARYLGELGVRAETAADAEGALRLAAELRPDVIFLDLQIPGESGWDVLAHLRADPDLAATPVVIASVVDERERGMAAGAAAYLVKPVARDVVARALDAAAAWSPAVPPAAPPPPPAADGARILLAEDNEVNIVAVGEYLQDRGYQLTVARDGREALALAAEVRPDLILMDIQMPEIDGIEATRRLRATPELAATPIIALTALAMPGDRERCLAAGADEYLTKPVSLRGLAETIRRMLERRG